ERAADRGEHQRLHRDTRDDELEVGPPVAGDRVAEQEYEHQHEGDRHQQAVHQLVRGVLELGELAPGEGETVPGGADRAHRTAPFAPATAAAADPAADPAAGSPAGSPAAGRPVSARNTSSRLASRTPSSATSIPAESSRPATAASTAPPDRPVGSAA